MIRIILIFLSLFTFEVWGDTIVENFNSSPERRWDFFTDQVMGGRSTGKLEFISSGETNYARLSGNVTTENNGGFIQFRAFLQNTLNSKIEGIKLEVRGNNQKYYLHIRTSGTVLPWQYYSATFNVDEQWKLVDIPLKQFQRSGTFMRKYIKPSSIKSLGVVAYGRNHQAELEVNKIIFY